MRFTRCAILLALAGCSAPAPEGGNAAVENAALPGPASTDNAAMPDNFAAELTEEALQAQPDARALPADVQQFIVRRQGCEHWAGEPGWDAERQKQIEEAVKELCPGIDKALSDLRVKYAGDAQVKAALREYQPLGMD